MGQYWKLVNIDRREKLLNNDGLKLVEILSGGSLEQLVELIRSPKWVPFSRSTNNIQVSKLNSNKSSLLKLPQEVIDMVVCNLSGDSSENIIYLSLTCVYFFRLLGPLVQSILAEDTAPWAGDRLVLVGDYADGLDVGDICTSDELREFKETEEEHGGNPPYHISDGISDDRVMCTESERARAEPGDLSGNDIRQAGALEQQIRDKLTSEDSKLFDRLTAIAKSTQLDADSSKHAPVLRNLTAKKYVQNDVIAKSDYAYSLGEVVGVFTQWTGDPSGTRDLDCVGGWAGNRFDIATMADVSEDGWTDVSQLAIENLRKGMYE
ncbi:hypothetical protein SLS64_006271 [Diaporthe eres]|uniref:F-box domain-containing protein n=1 Tax=Diaporthe eres TaxID=83184 RepID=A0ABR1NW71_DIAER